MIFYIIIFILIIFLIYTNALTDAPNAISTIVGTHTLSFKKAAFMSATFNLIGIVVMSIFNFSVANFMFSMIDMSDKMQGLSIIFSSMVSTIIFSNGAMFLGIPTSETHSLIAGITGAMIACNSLDSINKEEWVSIIVGLCFSIIGTYIITKIVNFIIRKISSLKSKNRYKSEKRNENQIKKMKKIFQIVTSSGVSFMHGAEDGQKFIGLLIAYEVLISSNNLLNVSNIYDLTNVNYFWIIILVSIVMFIGVATGGKKIVENLGENITNLNDDDAIISDIGTIIVLLISSLNGIPISTSHVKTISIVASVDSKKNVNLKKVLDIFKAWFYTFPVCMVISYVCMKILMSII